MRDRCTYFQLGLFNTRHSFGGFKGEVGAAASP